MASLRPIRVWRLQLRLAWRSRVVHGVLMLTGSIPSAEMGAAYRPFIVLIEPDFLPDVCGPRAHSRRKGYGYSITGST